MSPLETQLLHALKRLLANVEEFGFEEISIEHDLADGVPLARIAIDHAESL